MAARTHSVVLYLNRRTKQFSLAARTVGDFRWDLINNTMKELGFSIKPQGSARTADSAFQLRRELRAHYLERGWEKLARAVF